MLAVVEHQQQQPICSLSLFIRIDDIDSKRFLSYHDCGSELMIMGCSLLLQNESKYMKYLTKKYLKKHNVRDWLHVIPSNKDRNVLSTPKNFDEIPKTLMN
ncbi:hypothetical protein Ccrd_025418 [Cynara cardunculus var. scolymus]|uniref:Uncharacterized protein n=1 Tax=Cynara cardunculus var. scolymus TaxID=59895 RepID=A0A118JQJ3_CYNCS|nr:hypothetical protein Ccrd_025418 [Cynara cardunculus var. scolymus]